MAPMTAATTAVVVAVPPASPVPAAVAGPGVAVVEISDDDDDVPPPGWDQWASMPALAPEAPARALVAHGGAGAAPEGPTDGVGPSSSRAGGGRRPAGPPHRCSGGAGALGGAPRPRRLAQSGVERGVVDSWWSARGAPSKSVEFREVARPFPCFSFVWFLSDARFLCPACWWQELERRAREQYVAFDRLDAEFRWYRGQYEALEALVEALRSPDRWLVYRAEALLDSPLEQGA
jgi:hypothetical protein